MEELVAGIIGGMGPEATVDLMQKIIAHTEVKDDSGHIRCIVDNNPKIPSRIEAILGNGEDPGRVMAEVGKKLEEYGADFLVIPCNTAHYYYADVVRAVNVPVVNMITLVVNTICTSYPDMKKIGVLGSTTIVKTALYEKSFAALGVEVIYPDPDVQAELFELIKDVKSGKTDISRINKLNAIGKHLLSKGATLAILGCTELGILANQDLPVPYIDAAEQLAIETVAIAKRKKILPPDTSICHLDI